MKKYRPAPLSLSVGTVMRDPIHPENGTVYRFGMLFAEKYDDYVVPVRVDYTSLSPAKKCQFSSFNRSGLSAMSGL